MEWKAKESENDSSFIRASFETSRSMEEEEEKHFFVAGQ
jgi:hypothetical protein